MDLIIIIVLDVLMAVILFKAHKPVFMIVLMIITIIMNLKINVKSAINYANHALVLETNVLNVRK